MHRTSRTAAAALLCASLALPWVAGTLLGLHHGHSPHHQEPSAHDAEALDLIFHGHHHEPGAPEHPHSLVLAKQSPASTRPSALLVVAASTGLQPPAMEAAAGARIPPRDGAHAPPPGTTVSPILRI